MCTVGLEEKRSSKSQGWKQAITPFGAKHLFELSTEERAKSPKFTCVRVSLEPFHNH